MKDRKENATCSAYVDFLSTLRLQSILNRKLSFWYIYYVCEANAIIILVPKQWPYSWFLVYCAVPMLRLVLSRRTEQESKIFSASGNAGIAIQPEKLHSWILNDDTTKRWCNKFALFYYITTPFIYYFLLLLLFFFIITTTTILLFYYDDAPHHPWACETQTACTTTSAGNTWNKDT